MGRTSTRAPSLPLAALGLALAACTTQTYERGAMGQWQTPSANARSSAQAPPEQQPDAASDPAKDPAKAGKTVTVPVAVVDAFNAFANRKSILYSDGEVQVDASRDPCLGMTSITFAKDAVTRTDRTDERQGVVTITLTRIPEAAATRESVPAVRFGDGLEIVAVDRIVLRFWTKQSADRPVWMRATAAGRKAIYDVNGDASLGRKGHRVDLSSEIKLVGEAYRFDSSAQAQP